MSYTWPWEHPESIRRSKEFLKDKICENYLVREFTEIIKCFKNKQNYNFVCKDNTTFVVRTSCLGPTNSTWICNFGTADSDFVLFFGFRNRANPVLEFCLCIPLNEFSGKERITILDDGYHIKGYSEFSVPNNVLYNMQDTVIAINNQDKEFLQKYR